MKVKLFFIFLLAIFIHNVLLSNEIQDVVNGKTDSIYFRYSNKIVLPKAFRNMDMKIYCIEDKAVPFKLTLQKDGFIIEDLVTEGYYYLQVRNNRKEVVYQQLLFAKTMSDPIPTLNGDTIQVNYLKEELIKKFDFGLKMVDKSANNLCHLVQYDLIVKPEGKNPIQLTVKNNKDFDAGTLKETLLHLNNDARIFINNIIVKFDNDTAERNIGAKFFVVKD